VVVVYFPVTLGGGSFEGFNLNLFAKKNLAIVYLRIKKSTLMHPYCVSASHHSFYK
jgi:hypothetical protein